MSITIDDQPLAAGEFQSVGDVLEHVRRQDRGRLIVKVLLDGVVPAAEQLGEQRLMDRTLYVETADRRALAADALREAGAILDSADAYRMDAIEQLSAGRVQEAMGPLNQWLLGWQQVKKAIVESAWAVGANIEKLGISRQIAELADQLRQIITAVQNKDYVTLGDILNYEAPASMEKWREALGLVKEKI